ncbi:UNVERIFIED_CONTAM: hypothetical protein RMT77_007349 [Armadillidium vulgare]
MSKKDDGTVKVLNYMKQQNRPYSVNDIFLNLHKEIGKTAVQKALDSLVENGSLKEKVYGKQKVYVITQDNFPPLEDGKLKELDAKINELTEDLKIKTKEASDLESKKKNIGSSLTTEEAEANIKQIENEIALIKESLSKIQCNGDVVTQQEKERIEFDREKKLKEWKRRKRLAMDILNAILESYPKSKKELFDQIGIETDEEAAINPSLLS